MSAEKVEGRASSDNQKRVAAAFNAWCERASMAADDPDAPHAEAYFAGYRDGLRRFWRWFTAVHTDPYDDGYRDLYHEILGRQAPACPPPEEEK